MDWSGAILTDSGGYQVFSLSPLHKVGNDGINFRSHVDGSAHYITPEMAIRFQEDLGADIAMVLDECPAHDNELEYVTKAMNRTHIWAERCKRVHSRKDQELYAIVQGGIFPELRQQSAKYLTSVEFAGYAIGGLSIGEPKAVTMLMVEKTVAYLPSDRPRYLMGVGSPDDIIIAVDKGVDMFDSALPTRVARNGALFTWQGRRNIHNAVYRRMERSIDPQCDCYTCRTFSAAYLHHLFKCGELLALRLATIHNLTFMHDLMQKIRDAISDGSFSSFKNNFLAHYKPTNEQVRLSQKQKWLKSRYK